MEYHVPVLLKESIDGLEIKKNGVYVDVTFGGGGHSKEILKRLGEHGRLIGFDRDEDARRNKLKDQRLILIKSNYRFLKKQLKLEGVEKVDGILADLGVSSHQFDEASRGFSIRFDSELDMRMDRQQDLTAAQIVNTYGEDELSDIFYHFGEVRNARKLSARICSRREVQDVRTTAELVDVIAPIIIGKRNKYLAQVFQALRIEVNKELDSLKDFLVQALDVLKKGSRLVVLTYHSLEDRIVKNFMKNEVFTGDPVMDLYGRVEKNFHLITRKPIVASDEEIKENPRSRSAKLRIVQKR